MGVFIYLMGSPECEVDIAPVSKKTAVKSAATVYPFDVW